MALRLDLSSSDAKVARARDHVKVLKAEIAKIPQERHPYGIRVTEVDQNTGCTDIFLTPNNFHEPLLGIIFGDVIHNLRCALDYIVTAIADKTSVPLVKKHQFPIYHTEVDYRTQVGDENVAKASGCLSGIKDGLGEFWRCQPFKAHPNPKRDYLFCVNRFSNADKHRVISAAGGVPKKFTYELFGPGRIIEKEYFPHMGEWQPNAEHRIVRLRYARPFPGKGESEIKADIGAAIVLTTPAFDGQMPYLVALGNLEKLCVHVARTVNAFKALALPIGAHSAAVAYLWQVYNCRIA